MSRLTSELPDVPVVVRGPIRANRARVLHYDSRLWVFRTLSRYQSIDTYPPYRVNVRTWEATGHRGLRVTMKTCGCGSGGPSFAPLRNTDRLIQIIEASGHASDSLADASYTPTLTDTPASAESVRGDDS